MIKIFLNQFFTKNKKSKNFKKRSFKDDEDTTEFKTRTLKVEINGNKSVNLSCIDKYGNVICSYELKDGFIPEKIKIKKYKSITLGSKIKAAKQALKIKNKM